MTGMKCLPLTKRKTMSEDPQKPQPAPDCLNMPDVPSTLRPAFFDEAAERSQQFAKDMLKLIPELDGVAVIPSWSRDYGNQVFFGVMVGRHGDGLRPPMETMHMAVQLHRALNHIVQQSFAFLKYVDSASAEKLNELRELEGRLTEHAQHEQPQPPEGNTPGGAAPAGAPEGQHL